MASRPSFIRYNDVSNDDDFNVVCLHFSFFECLLLPLLVVKKRYSIFVLLSQKMLFRTLIAFFFLDVYSSTSLCGSCRIFLFPISLALSDLLPFEITPLKWLNDFLSISYSVTFWLCFFYSALLVVDKCIDQLPVLFAEINCLNFLL